MGNRGKGTHKGHPSPMDLKPGDTHLTVYHRLANIPLGTIHGKQSPRPPRGK